MTSPTVSAVAGGTDFWGTTASTIQTDVSVTGNYISGTLHKLTTGALARDWGEGYFLGLDFTDIPEDAVVKVGVVPTQGSGMVELDADHNGVFKITDHNTQVIKVVTTKGDKRQVDTYNLGTLTLD